MIKPKNYSYTSKFYTVMEQGTETYHIQLQPNVDYAKVHPLYGKMHEDLVSMNDWCEANIRSYYSRIRDNISLVYSFTDRNEAIMFKLTHAG